jgi:hypothetical protein
MQRRTPRWHTSVVLVVAHKAGRKKRYGGLLVHDRKHLCPRNIQICAVGKNPDQGVVSGIYAASILATKTAGLAETKEFPSLSKARFAPSYEP